MNKKKGLRVAELERRVFLSAYANIPAVMRDKCCGLSWNDVYKLLEAER